MSTESDPLMQLADKMQAKLGVAPLMPDYARNHPDGALMACAYNFLPLVIGTAGYEGCEMIFQNKRELFPIANQALESLGSSIEEVVRHQGSDFFGSVFYTQMHAAAVCEFVRMGAQKLAPESKFTHFFEKQYKTIRSVVGFAMLTAYEAKQAIDNNAPLDYKDVFAYSAGIITLCHGRQIAKGICKGIKNIFSRSTSSSSQCQPQ